MRQQKLLYSLSKKKHAEDKRITKLGFKPVFPDCTFSQTVLSVMEKLKHEHLHASVYAHIKNSDIQVNFLPEDYEEYQKSKNVINKLI